MTDSALDTIGKRLYRIRLDRGDGHRRPEPLAKFVQALREVAPTVKGFAESALSGWENDLSEPSVRQIAAIARLDPKGRGRAWLAWGDAERSTAAERHAGRLADPQDEPEAYGRVIPHEMFTPAQPPEEEAAPPAPRRAGGRKRRA